MTPPGINHHCCVVDIDGRGILIEGRSGSGKTSLALGLVDTCRSRGRVAHLVCDDQAILTCHDGRLFANCPPLIRGKAEIRGFGITQVDSLDISRLVLAVRLVDDEDVPRMPEPRTGTYCGTALPLVTTPRRHEAQAIRIILAWLQEHRETAE
ncbi:MAG: HPr kinase/phosphatase C-terminal domain-containing protein [Nitratireductor sp.]|nr:HPr kinase/phosphatase C-terminal domain-containing protein [Nitratireductor sp.]